MSRDGPFTAPQLKVLQESISLTVFAVFSVLVLKERLRLRDAVAFGLIFLGACGLLLLMLLSTMTGAVDVLLTYTHTITTINHH